MKSEHRPDVSLWHDNIQYPRVIIEVTSSQKMKRLGQLAEEYFLGLGVSVQVGC